LAGQNNFCANGYRFNHSSFKHRQLYGDAMSQKVKIELEKEDINFIKGILESRLIELKLDRLSVEKILRSIGKAK